MRYALFVLLVMLQLPLFPQKKAEDANAALDKAIEKIKSGLPMEINYAYGFYDDGGEALQKDNGIIYMDNARYALLMQDMKVWCDGATQWSYMREVDEVYVTDADSDEAQNLSPLYVMEHCRDGYSVSSVDKGKVIAVKLQPQSGVIAVGNVELHISKENDYPVAMFIDMPGLGKIVVSLNGFIANCGVGDSIFVCPLDEFSTAEIIDMR